MTFKEEGPPMSISLRQLAELVGGQVRGDPEILITAARSLQEAQAGDITFVEDDKHLPLLSQCRASAAVTSSAVTKAGISLIQVADPLAAFMIIVRHFQGGTAAISPIGVDPRAPFHQRFRCGVVLGSLPSA